MLHYTRGADLGLLVAPAPSQQTNKLFFAGFTFLWLYGRGLYKVGAQPALLAGVTHPWQWIWHSQLTLHTQLCLSGNVLCQWMSCHHVLLCTKEANLGLLVAPAFFHRFYLPLAIWWGALQRLNAQPALLVGVTHPQQWMWHL